jgi:hypothetical protein
MSEPIEAVAAIANTPEQAKVFVATLMAAGIPARIEGESLTDEWAASRRMLNLLGTRVMVPTKTLRQAKELLQPVAIDPEELERQALAAAPAPVAAPAPRSEAADVRGWGWLVLLLLPIVVAVGVMAAN